MFNMITAVSEAVFHMQDILNIKSRYTDGHDPSHFTGISRIITSMIPIACTVQLCKTRVLAHDISRPIVNGHGYHEVICPQSSIEEVISPSLHSSV